MRLRRLALPGFGLLGLAAACSSFTATPAEPADAGSEANEAGEVDVVASPPDPAPLDAGPLNLLVNPGFEDGCGSWGSTGSRTQPTFDPVDSPTHTGAHACKVCATGDGGPFAIAQVVTLAGDAGARFTGSLWVHAAGDAGGGLDDPTATLVTSDGNQYTLEFFNGPGPAVDGVWKPATTALTTTKPFQHVELRFGVVAPARGYCFVVDDGSLTVANP